MTTAETSSRRRGCSSSPLEQCRSMCLAPPRTPWSAGQGAAAGQGPGPYPDPDFRQLDSWIVIREDNTATFYVGKTDLGQGTGTAFRQIMCGRAGHALRPDQLCHGPHRRDRRSGRIRRLRRAADRRLADAPGGGRSAPCAARDGRDAFRRARRRARVSDGVVSITAEPARRISYGELIGGRRFNVTLTGKNTDTDDRRRAAQAGPGSEAGRAVAQRYDIPAKVDGSLEWAVDVKLPGMVHARNVRPPFAGATLVSIDEASVRREASRGSSASSARATTSPSSASAKSRRSVRRAQLEGELAKAGDRAVSSVRRSLHVHASARRRRSAVPNVTGDPDAHSPAPSKVVEAEYEVPFQGTPRSARRTRRPIRPTIR
jgi:nicotinate dehydrogenase subunit B